MDKISQFYSNHSAHTPMKPSTADSDRLTHIFLPHIEQKIREVSSAGGRFVYYTTADTAASIIRSKQIWLRNTSAMTDYTEVEHGFRCLKSAYDDEPGKGFRAALNTCFLGLAEEVTNSFNPWLPGIRQDTYIACVSEHCSSEDRHGRLSMWRAYGGKTGVALVLNGAVMFSKSNALNILSSPVAYLSPDSFRSEFMKVTQNIENECEFIKTLDRPMVRDAAFNMLLFAVLCTKHPGFHEEREWRVIASPAMYPPRNTELAIEVIRGTPQKVLKLALQNIPEQGLSGLVLPELIDRIIIGPCEFPQVIYSALRQLLIEAEVPDPDQKVIVSDIPLRQP